VTSRIVLAVTALLVLAWVGVLLRDHVVGRDGIEARDPEQIDSAKLLDPNRYWDQARASAYLLNGDFARGAADAEALVRAEPENAVAWALLRGATSQTDPERSAEAAAELKRLNPHGVP
jgi:hypothetical protein